MSSKWHEVKQGIVEAARRDPRIVGVVDYGATSEGRGDEWSDLDIALFLRDDDLDAFEANWVGWASQFGTLLLAYIGGVGHPWAVYDARPVPLRADLAFRRESAVEDILTWPTAPTSVEAMVWYDATGGKLTACVGQIVGQSLAPPDLHGTFDQVCGDFWYYLLRTSARLWRGELWAARYDFNFVIVGNLLALLRLEAGATERWRASSAPVEIERVLAPARLSVLERCIPGPGQAGLKQAMVDAAALGFEVCEAIARQRGWTWPRTLARQVEPLLRIDEAARLGSVSSEASLPSPDTATRAAVSGDGTMLDDKQWDVGAAGAVVQENQVLMVRATYGGARGRWLLPGGYASHEERLDQTAVREVWEETGVVAEVVDVIGLRTRYTERGGAVFVLFRMRPLSGEPLPDGVEVDQATYFSAAEIGALDDEEMIALARNAALAALSEGAGLPEDVRFPLRDETYNAYLVKRE